MQSGTNQLLYCVLCIDADQTPHISVSHRKKWCLSPIYKGVGSMGIGHTFRFDELQHGTIRFKIRAHEIEVKLYGI